MSASAQFLQPETVTSDALREALLWKYGHLGKPRILPHTNA